MCRSEKWKCLYGPIYPATANDDVAVVEDDSLSWRDRALWRVERKLGAGVIQGAHASCSGGMAMANLR